MVLISGVPKNMAVGLERGKERKYDDGRKGLWKSKRILNEESLAMEY